MNTFKKIPIIPFILESNFGFSHMGEKNGVWQKLSNGEDVLICREMPRINGTYEYKLSYNGTMRYTILDFLDKYGHGESPEILVNKYLGKSKKDEIDRNDEINIVSNSRSFKDKIKDKEFIYQYIIHDGLVHYQSNFLTEKKIKPEVVNSYSVKANKFFASMLCYRELDEKLDGDPIGITRYFSEASHFYPRSIKRYCVQYGWGVLKKDDLFQRLYICTSIISALSLESILLLRGDFRNRAYILSFENIPQERYNDLISIAKKTKVPIVFALDVETNDEKKIIENNLSLTGGIFKKCFCPELDFIGNLRDWNKLLAHLSIKKNYNRAKLFSLEEKYIH